MKKVLLFLSVLCLCMSLILLSSCGKDKGQKDEITPCEEHTDVNKDSICDICQEKIKLPCTHADSNKDGYCDKCNESFSIPKVDYTIEIKDESGDPLSGISVSLMLDSTNVSTSVTNESGKASGSIEAGNYYINIENLPLYWTTEENFTLITISESNKNFSFVAYDHSPNGSLERPYPSEDAETGEGTEVSIPAEASYYFAIKGSSRYLVINNENVKVTYGETDYLPDGGQIKVAIAATENYSQNYFIITNTSTESTNVKIEFEAIPGTAAAPFDAVLNTPITVTVTKGDTIHYSFTATSNGTLSVSSDSPLAKISFYNSNTYVGETASSFNVNEGDVIIIYIESSNSTEPSTDITFTLTFS